jgi:hypothetical protein
MSVGNYLLVVYRIYHMEGDCMIKRLRIKYHLIMQEYHIKRYVKYYEIKALREYHDVLSDIHYEKAIEISGGMQE